VKPVQGAVVFASSGLRAAPVPNAQQRTSSPLVLHARPQQQGVPALQPIVRVVPSQYVWQTTAQICAGPALHGQEQLRKQLSETMEAAVEAGAPRPLPLAARMVGAVTRSVTPVAAGLSAGAAAQQPGVVLASPRLRQAKPYAFVVGGGSGGSATLPQGRQGSRQGPPLIQRMASTPVRAVDAAASISPPQLSAVAAPLQGFDGDDSWRDAWGQRKKENRSPTGGEVSTGSPPTPRPRRDGSPSPAATGSSAWESLSHISPPPSAQIRRYGSPLRLTELAALREGPAQQVGDTESLRSLHAESSSTARMDLSMRIHLQAQRMANLEAEMSQLRDENARLRAQAYQKAMQVVSTPPLQSPRHLDMSPSSIGCEVELGMSPIMR